MKKALFVLLLVAAAGCHKSESLDFDSDLVAVSFSIANVSAEVSSSTRADVTPPAGTEVRLDEGATVRVLAFQRAAAGSAADITADTQVTPYGEATYVVQADGKLTPCNVKADGSVDASSSATPVSIRLRAATYDFYALTPAIPISKAGGYKVSIANGTDHAASCTEAQVIPAGADKHPVTLKVLDRKCAKVSFTFDRKEEAKSVTRIDVDTVYLTSIAHSPSAPTLLCAALDRGTNDANFSFPKGFVTYDADGVKTGFDCFDEVLPKTEAKFGIGVKVRFNDPGKTKIPSDLVAKPEQVPAIAFNPKYHYNFKVTLQGKSVTLTLNVGDWDTVDWDDFTIGGAPGVSINVGQWEVLDWDDFNVGGGTQGNLTFGDWTQNPNWAEEIGGNPVLSGALTSAGWDQGPTDADNVGSGTSAGTSVGNWGNGVDNTTGNTDIGA